MSLSDRIKECFKPSREETATAVLNSYRISGPDKDELLDDMWPLVRDSVQRRRRRRARAVEKAAEKAGALKPGRRRRKHVVTRDEKATVKSARQLLLESPFMVDHELVSWGEATYEDHQLRIKELSVKRDGLEDTIARHKLAIKLIDEAGVTCLKEIVEE